ncbi:flagellar hook-basal body protein [Tepidibacter aestuarii]|uniref:flagellar hook-basal body protein n=1 Tax=Tepidibacter aestuarii TaxID=2925782 RepID=UPI0020C01257|nr:flagellar hook-basal body protein [Tepidibacter aestuarii]CAH2211864.1 Flagellar basal body protein [Tepidibacter aestuarii]
MFRGLYTVTSGMQTNQKKLDVISNNIANANTSGFKKDVVISEAFPEMLISKINGKLENDINNTNGKLKLDIQRDGQGFYLKSNKGFFTVDSPMGTSYNKSVRFSVDEEGYLKTYTRDIDKGIDTSTGFYLLDSEQNKIKVDNNDIQVDDKSGNIISNGNVVANLIYTPSKNVIGTINGGLRLDRIQTNFISGQMKQTDNKLDFAIKGKGFFKIQTEDGIRYTRDGSFLLNDKGELVNADGNYVLGKEGIITMDKGFKINKNGDIYIKDEYYGTDEYYDTIDVVNVLNVNALRKEGNNLYKVEEGIDPNEQKFDADLLQGFIETSNVNSVNEMVDMITVFREYESNQKVVKAYDEMLGKAVNEIGKV